MTLAPDGFRIEGYFEAYVECVEDHRLAHAKRRNPELVEFNPPVTNKDGLGDEETTPLDGEARSPDG